MRSSTTLVELQNTILLKLGVARSKRVSKLFYRAPVVVVSEHVKYGSFAVQTDADLDVIFHYRRDFLEVRTTVLYAKFEDIIASSDGSNPNPPSFHIGGSSSSAPVALVVPVIPPSVASPSFTADLHRENNDECDLEDNRTFAIALTHEENDPGVGFGGGGSVDVLMPNQFEIGQIFQMKEDVVLSVKSYNIHHGIEYKVKESD
ncbi:hypothetical protein PIB30_079789 [Stylosanthes scabra]|uniref:Uncharacterized protein n=1 Tax=Stylosanthes scabra TaxID=79078 RepID=A0ABU6QSM5_9FABA|nr:hypothetical protein [Stylosanthes scabra]